MLFIKKISQKIILDGVYLLIGKVKGEKYLPIDGGYIVASNHASHIDPFTIGSIIFKERHKIVRYIGKKESLSNLVGRFVYSTFGVIPIDRNSRSKTGLNAALKYLKNKDIIGIFPEGTRTQDGKIQKGKTGVARLAIYANAQVLPVAIKNTYLLWPKHKKFPRIKRIIKVNIGKPLYFSPIGKIPSKKMLRQATNLIMDKISRLHSSI